MRYLKASREELQAPKGKFRVIGVDVNEGATGNYHKGVGVLSSLPEPLVVWRYQIYPGSQEADDFMKSITVQLESDLASSPLQPPAPMEEHGSVAFAPHRMYVPKRKIL